MANRVTPLTQIEALSGNISAATYFDNNIGPAFSALNDASLGYVNYQGTDSGSANNYIVAAALGTPSAYNAGMTVTFKPANTNTGASTLTVSPLASQPIQHGDGTACIGGELQAGKVITLEYNGSAFLIIGPPFLYGTTLYYDYDDFIFVPSANQTKLFQLFASGNGTVAQSGFNTGHPGAFNFACGTTLNKSTGAASNGLVALDTVTITIRTILFTPSTIDANQTALALTTAPTLPLSSSASAIGLFASSASSFWQMYTSNGSTQTITATTTSVVAGTWYDLMIVATASSATFYVNGTQIGTQSLTYPASSTLMSIFAGIQASSGTSRTAAVDMVEILISGIAVLSGSTLPRFLHGLV